MLLLGNYTLSALTASIIILFFSMGIHEFAHAYVAHWWGDPTPKQNGKLTINPMAHIDLQGWIWIMLIGFGTAGSVAINPYRMRDTRWGSFWTSLAGPVSNLLQAIVFGLLLRFLGDVRVAQFALGNEVWQLGTFGINPIIAYINLLLFVGVFFNIVLFVFNMLPLSPLDGYRILLALLPGDFLTRQQIPDVIHRNLYPLSRFLQQPAYVWQSWQMLTYYGFIGLIGLSFFAQMTNLHIFNLLGHIIGGPVNYFSALIIGL